MRGWILALLLLLAACSLTPSPPPLPPPSAEQTPIFAALPQFLVDQSPLMYGICFEAAFDAAERVFVIRSEQELSRFFDLADNSHLCRRPVKREALDFSNGRVLVGLWSKGLGCTAKHDVLDVQRDDTAKTLAITLDFITEGTCPYELVRPFWISVDGVSDYTISIEIMSPDVKTP